MFSDAASSGLNCSWADFLVSPDPLAWSRPDLRAGYFEWRQENLQCAGRVVADRTHGPNSQSRRGSLVVPPSHPVQLGFLDLFSWFRGWVFEI